jgi:hypothetical protein
MANKIQIRRSATSLTAPAAGSLENGELAWVDHSASAGGAGGILYIGDVSAGTAIVRTIGGTLTSQYTLDLLTDTALTGTPTAPTQLVSTAPSNQVATSQYVDDRIAQSGGAFETLTDTLFITTPNAVGELANGHLAIFDKDAGVWENKAAGGDVTMDKEGVILVNSVQAGAISPDTDFNTTYVSDVTGTANEVEVTPTDVGVNRTIQVGLPNDVTITGNLTVQGTTTQVDSTVVSLADPVFVIGDNVATQDRGIEYKDSDGSNTLGYFGFSRAQNAFTYIPDATNTSEVFTGAAGDAVFANIEGVLTTAVQPNVTSAANLETVGEITTGEWKSTLISSEFGGTGINTSAATGVGIVTGGTWSTPSTLPQSFGGTGLSADAAAGAILVGGGAGNSMTTLVVGSAGQHLTMNGAGTAPEWSDEVDGGTF